MKWFRSLRPPFAKSRFCCEKGPPLRNHFVAQASPPMKPFRSCETPLWHIRAISQPHTTISQLRNGLWNGLQAAKLTCEMGEVCENTLWSQEKLQKCQQSHATMHLKRRDPRTLRSHTQSLSLHFKPLKTIRAHSSSWELQLRRLFHLRRLPEQKSKSRSNPLRMPPQMHQLHRTLPLLDHFFTFCLYILY